MLIHCLGVAAGGGYPQWNCACAGCRKARTTPERASAHAGLAVSGTGDRWYLLNATPDVHHQIAADPRLHPGPGARDTPVAGVLLTDAEFDHTIGLLVLREGSALEVHGTAPVLAALTDHFPVRDLVADYADFRWRTVHVGKPVDLDERLQVTAFATGSKPPRYVGHHAGPGEWETGYVLHDPVSGGTAVYAPGVPRWDEHFAEQVADADCVFVDGTFWTDDEMARQGTGDRPGRSMGHMPISGPDGSARQLAALPARRKIYVHVNNTNPILDESSAERAELAAQGIEVGRAGLEVEL
ncbi:pyrroloquinoline quinone biosynthesis protein PqqB [Saccharopolyspora sp. ID03-671]|uniref:pyrroloquinoline quinone biosynthesis protein PqqB n=1 Tax=Saccharopolyspora sp. ID03-671 TaxID=3073066 RepID=UPI0032534775